MSRKYINDVILWPALCSGREFHCGRMREQRPMLGPLSPFCGVVHIPAYTSGQGRSKTSMAAAQVLSDNHMPKSTVIYV